MISKLDLKLIHHASQCESECLEWLERHGQEGREGLLTLAMSTLAPLLVKEDLDDEEKNMLFLSQFALHGICNAWTTLQERKDDE